LLPPLNNSKFGAFFMKLRMRDISQQPDTNSTIQVIKKHPRLSLGTGAAVLLAVAADICTKKGALKIASVVLHLSETGFVFSLPFAWFFGSRTIIKLLCNETKACIKPAATATAINLCCSALVNTLGDYMQLGENASLFDSAASGAIGSLLVCTGVSVMFGIPIGTAMSCLKS
jgi:hypothetical protein